MAKKYSELRKRLSPAAREVAVQEAAKLMLELTLQQLRQSRQLTQKNLAAELQVDQAAVSKLERQTDMYVSTLRRHIKAMGGDLQIIAHFPDGDVLLNQLGENDKPAART
jgi:DNA-binding XRE family transcriptional regulator